MRSLNIILTKAIAIVAAAMVLSACTNSTEELYEVNSEPQLEIINNLKAFNDSLRASMDTRGSKLLPSDYAKLFVSDAKGAYTGAKLGGIIGSIFGPHGSTAGMVIGATAVGGAASYVKYHEITGKSQQKKIFGSTMSPTISQQAFELVSVDSRSNIMKVKYSEGVDVGLDSCICQIGIAHNLILDNVDAVNIDSVGTAYEKKLTPIEKSIVSSELFVDKFNQVVENPDMLEVDSTSNIDTLMSMYLELVRGLSQSYTDVRTATRGYVTTIKESTELSDSEKETLLSGISVTWYSYTYWREKFNAQWQWNNDNP